MIRVRHNGAERVLELARGAHLGEVIEACARDDGGLVTAVRVDGCEIPEANLDKLESFPLEGVELVEVTTRPQEEIARASLESSASYAVAVCDSLRQTAAHLRAGRIEDANRLYAEAADALGVLLFAVAAAARVLGGAASALEGLEGELQPWLESVVDAQKDRDWLRVADYLEFEVAERVADWCARIESVRGAAQEGAHGSH